MLVTQFNSGLMDESNCQQGKMELTTKTVWGCSLGEACPSLYYGLIRKFSLVTQMK